MGKTLEYTVKLLRKSSDTNPGIYLRLAFFRDPAFISTEQKAWHLLETGIFLDGCLLE